MENKDTNFHTQKSEQTHIIEINQNNEQEIQQNLNQAQQELLDKAQMKKQFDEKQKNLTRETLYEEILLQNTYTDIVDLILKYIKSKKGSPDDLVTLLDHIKEKLLVQLYEFREQMGKQDSTLQNKDSMFIQQDILDPENLQQEDMQLQVNGRDTIPKIQKLMQQFYSDEMSFLVDFYLKLLYSTHKNKKAPAYMLTSILSSLDKVNFDRNKKAYKFKALEILKLMKPQSYQIMIEIFQLNDQDDFFIELIKTKIQEEKYRDIIFINDIFPELLKKFQSFLDFQKIEQDSSKDIRQYLMHKLIIQNDITTARLLINEKSKDSIYDKVFLVQKQFNQVKNAKKAALLIKEFQFEYDLVNQEFYHIEDTVLQIFYFFDKSYRIKNI